MFTTKAFIKKNKVGNYLKVGRCASWGPSLDVFVLQHVREHYIRDDISCGLQECENCLPVESFLSPDHKNPCSLFKYNHYLILDTNVVLDQVMHVRGVVAPNC
jgi:hypothetical protein